MENAEKQEKNSNEVFQVAAISPDEWVTHSKEIYEYHTEEETEIEDAIPETIEETPNNIEIELDDISPIVKK